MVSLRAENEELRQRVAELEEALDGAVVSVRGSARVATLRRKV